jgi:hypothetical protein
LAEPPHIQRPIQAFAQQLSGLSQSIHMFADEDARVRAAETTNGDDEVKPVKAIACLVIAGGVSVGAMGVTGVGVALAAPGSAATSATTAAAVVQSGRLMGRRMGTRRRILPVRRLRVPRAYAETAGRSRIWMKSRSPRSFAGP